MKIVSMKFVLQLPSVTLPQWNRQFKIVQKATVVVLPAHSALSQCKGSMQLLRAAHENCREQSLNQGLWLFMSQSRSLIMPPALCYSPRARSRLIVRSIVWLSVLNLMYGWMEAQKAGGGSSFQCNNYSSWWFIYQMENLDSVCVCVCVF